MQEDPKFLKFTDAMVDKLEDIYRAQEKPRFYSWAFELNDQFKVLEERMSMAGVSFVVTNVRQNCDNLCLSVSGEPDEVAWMDMALLGYSNRKRYKHLLILEHRG